MLAVGALGLFELTCELTLARPGITLVKLQRRLGEHGIEAGFLTTI